MDNLALSLSKYVTEFLEQNERRFVKQNSLQEKHNQLLADLNNRVEQLESRNQELTTENVSLKSELEVLKKRDDTSMRDIITIKSDLEKMNAQVNECKEWVRLMTALTQEVHNLNESKKTQEKVVDNLQKNQADIKIQLDKQQRHIEATVKTAQAAAVAAASAKTSLRSSTVTSAPQYTIKTPSRSPSTASFFNGNMNRLQSSTPTFKPSTNNLFSSNQNHNNTHHLHNHNHIQQQFHTHELGYNGSLEANDDDMMSEVSEQATSLLNQVEALNDFHQRSFGGGGGGSICSDG